MCELRNSIAFLPWGVLFVVWLPQLASAEKGVDQFQLASRQFASGQCQNAIHEFEEFLQAFPDHRLCWHARFLLGEAMMECGRFADARQHFRDSLITLPGHPYSKRTEFRLGEAAYLNGDHPSARVALRDFSLAYPSDPLTAHAVHLLIEIAFDQKDHQEVERLGSEFVVRFSKSRFLEAVQLTRARAYSNVQQPALAADLLRELLLVRPASPREDEVLYRLAWASIDLGQSQEAQRLFGQLVNEYPQSAFYCDSAYRVARAAAERGELGKAAEQLSGLALDDCQPKVRAHVLFSQAELTARQLKWSEVGPPLERLLREYPASELAHGARYYLAEASYRLGQFAEAQRRFSELCDEQLPTGTDWTAMVSLRTAQLLSRKGDWLEAFESAAEISHRFPEFRRQYEVDYFLGRCLAAQARFRESRDMYQRVIDSDSGRGTEFPAMAQWMIGETYLHQRKCAMAIDAYTLVGRYEGHPQWQAAALLQIGKCREQSGEIVAAQADYSQLIMNYPESRFAVEARTLVQQLAGE